MPRAENTLAMIYSATQRKSVMLMMSIGKFCELFGLRDREESTVVLFDESWIFNSSKKWSCDYQIHAQSWSKF
ncbi:hypothetical protein BK811_15685 [Listeria monocytogenes]|uniref:ATP-binding protein n=1 Tax=Listeria monocytogenes TaxID=1639 RepID=UPI0008F5D62F|nr:ATP-binding protein [Listeria monocytogenes]OIJ53609.1 hypothetical protein BK811_15685 [Listeria monocytogenes]